jgi:hypothetical protein
MVKARKDSMKTRKYLTNLNPVVTYLTDEEKHYYSEAAKRVPGRSLSRFIAQALQALDRAEIRLADLECEVMSDIAKDIQKEDATRAVKRASGPAQGALIID